MHFFQYRMMTPVSPSGDHEFAVFLIPEDNSMCNKKRDSVAFILASRFLEAGVFKKALSTHFPCSLPGS